MSFMHPGCDSWQIRPDANIAWRFWDGEYVVHHILSNDTFRLSEYAGRILICLADGDAQPAQTLAASCDVDEADVKTVLEELSELGFVVQC